MPCEHEWVANGARGCPRSSTGEMLISHGTLNRPSEFCSQPVYVCELCGEIDYGYQGGPAYEMCSKCELEPNGWGQVDLK